MHKPLVTVRKTPRERAFLSNLRSRRSDITGAAGTGQTMIWQVMTQALSDISVPLALPER